MFNATLKKKMVAYMLDMDVLYVVSIYLLFTITPHAQVSMGHAPQDLNLHQ